MAITKGVRAFRRKKAASGHIAYRHPRVSVSFDRQLFSAIAMAAKDDGKPFGAAVRDLCHKALMTARGV